MFWASDLVFFEFFPNPRGVICAGGGRGKGERESVCV